VSNSSKKNNRNSTDNGNADSPPVMPSSRRRTAVVGHVPGPAVTSSVLVAGDRTPVDRKPRRLLSLDVVRGLAVAGMLLVNNPGVRAATPAPLRHSVWSGFSPADAIFPIFLFAIGMSIPMSTRAAAPRQVLRRVVMLWLLGAALVTLKYRHLGLGAGVLQHIAGAYLLSWLVLRLPRRWQPVAAVALLLAGWAAMTVAPGGYRVLAGEGPAVDLASAASILGGVFVARTVLGRPVEVVVRRLTLWATASVAVGLVLAIPIPVVKHLWTPSYAVIAHGVACGVLLVVHWLVHQRGQRWWIRPFTDFGSNPIAIYLAVSVAAAVVLAPIRGTLVTPVVAAFGPATSSVIYAVAVALAGWALAAGLRHREVYIRV
jgi:predicted acyltransferase